MVFQILRVKASLKEVRSKLQLGTGQEKGGDRRGNSTKGGYPDEVKHLWFEECKGLWIL